MIGHGKAFALPDCAAYNRVIASSADKTKVRPVWGYPLDVIVEGARFFYPTYKHVKSLKRDHCYGLVLENACDGQQYIIDMYMSCKTPETTAFVGDWSKFDSSIPAWLIRDIFNEMYHWYDFSHVIDSEQKIWPANAEQSIRRYWKLVNYFINTPIRLPDGSRYRKNYGVPSGSMFTNIIDTFINAIVTRYCVYHASGALPYGDIYYGDDLLTFVRLPFNMENVAQVGNITFGMTLNLEKSYLTDEIRNLHWLGFYCNYGEPVRNNDFLLASYIFPEREVTFTMETATRCMGQLFSTLDPVQAVVWYDILQEVMSYLQIPPEDLIKYIKINFRKSFKYLKTQGWTRDALTVPLVHKGLFRFIPLFTSSFFFLILCCRNFLNFSIFFEV
jgi:hypothetical protein